MAFENPVTHGHFGDVADKNPERPITYDTNVKKGDTKTGTNECLPMGHSPGAHTHSAPHQGRQLSARSHNTIQVSSRVEVTS